MALLLAALGAFIVAGARPAAVITLPTQQQAILLVMDVSGSMRAADVAPDRITASQTAAKAFATELPRSVRIGVVAYAGTAQLMQPPTLSREDALAGIDLSRINGQRNMPRESQPAGPGRADPPPFTPAAATLSFWWFGRLA